MALGVFGLCQQWFSKNQPAMRTGGTPMSHASPYFMKVSYRVGK